MESELISFNGAVTFWLRKSNFGGVWDWKTPRLQWGRNFLVTEICYGISKVSPCALQLQWGRNFLVTEIRVRETGEHASERLQWGRNFLVTEIKVERNILKVA